VSKPGHWAGLYNNEQRESLIYNWTLSGDGEKKYVTGNCIKERPNFIGMEQQQNYHFKNSTLPRMISVISITNQSTTAHFHINEVIEHVLASWETYLVSTCRVFLRILSTHCWSQTIQVLLNPYLRRCALL
jgi:hypothetical protein